MLLGVSIMLVASIAIKQLVCLTHPYLIDFTSSDFLVVEFLFAYGFFVVVTSFFGFVAAVHESMPHLFQHAIALAKLASIGFILAGVTVFRGIDSVVDENCTRSPPHVCYIDSCMYVT